MRTVRLEKRRDGSQEGRAWVHKNEGSRGPQVEAKIAVRQLVNQPDARGETPLRMAAAASEAEIVSERAERSCFGCS